MHVREFVIGGAAVAVFLAGARATGQQLRTGGQPAELTVRQAGARSIRVTLRPASHPEDPPFTPAVAERTYPAPALRLRDVTAPTRRTVGQLRVDVHPNPLTLTVSDAAGAEIQRVVFEPDGSLSFQLGDAPVLGLGGGGPRPAPGTPWRQQPVQFDRRGVFDSLVPRWQSDMYGSRSPVAMLWGTDGWGLFVATPWGHVDLRDPARGIFIPYKPTAADSVPQNQRNQQQNAGKGIHPVRAIVPGLIDFFIFDARDPVAAMRDFSVITGPAALPPRWALGYMQSHRTIEDDEQLIGIIDTFRAKQIPLDAVIYLGTGFAPRGWNTPQPSFAFNPDVFKREPKAVLADMHARNVKVIVHIVPWDRDRLPTLQGSIPPKPGETVDQGHILTYWRQHQGLIDAGIDAFWPDEGDWFDLFERVKRHQLYYQGLLSSRPNTRPWSLQRNGYPGIAQWGGWVWSGDTEASWKTLEAQIAVGLNYSLSIGPFWGSDIAGFYANAELTGELYARWFQFAAFCASFRGHGRNWQLRLPWGWGMSDFGPREYNNTNAAIPENDRRNILASELNNPAIEPIAKQYAELRYRLLPYTYTLTYEAREFGLPLMRALWLHYPTDARARGVATEYLWGRDLLVAPVFEKGATHRNVYLPAGEWYDWWTNERLSGGKTVYRPIDLATMPIYVRAGAIVPVDPARQYTAQPATAPTTLRVYRGANGAFTLYDDDGISLDYQRRQGSWIRITWNDAAGRLTLEPGAPPGATNVVAPRTFNVVALPDGEARTVRYTGTRIVTTMPVR